MNSSRNGSLGLPTEIVEYILIQAVGEWPKVDFTTEGESWTPAVIDLDIVEKSGERWLFIEIQSSRIGSVCRLWHNILIPHRFEVLHASTATWTHYTAFRKLCPQFKERRNHVRRLVIDGDIRVKVPVKELASIIYGFLNDLPRRYIDRTLTHLTIIGVDGVMASWKSIVGHISKLEALKSLALGDVPFLSSAVLLRSPKVLPQLLTLDIEFLHDSDDTSLVLTIETFSTVIRLPALQRIRLREIPTLCDAKLIQKALSSFQSTLTFVDIEVYLPEYSMPTSSDTSLSFPELTHVDTILPLHNVSLQDIFDLLNPQTLSINYVNRLWEWVDVIEEGVILPMITYAEIDFEEMFQDIYKAVRDSQTRGSSALKTVVLGDMVPSLRMPTRADSYWTTLTGIFGHWIAEFLSLGVTVLARRSRTEPLQPVLSTLSAIIAQEKTRASTIRSSEDLNPEDPEDFDARSSYENSALSEVS
ncbi:hypothetical protein FRC14_003536 [Serendipita sp. 396]|nr:hypothetical protein FRC14_003536 [Serendipita sp. 396]KAG8782916.1 hypothetical protein FRC15_006042 [Serendipita sp. 397]KAG8820275.1 hypothetical protein FRC19_009010 [Serendipita sp. 401]KAG8839130.1 hypothetical protein FRC18_000517 [Serendipita sp. 400]KAG8857742.1 hypothetical protein FRB91_010900 [Serendipita sp. 411]KAG8867146.1 hypothetical protein FRC20_006581 [Serendipita sp. 405]KAG9053302.1 hypothetical protein FS842_008379 [Serendipita sp. 407]